jgi:hypothetical protein
VHCRGAALTKRPITSIAIQWHKSEIRLERHDER